MTSQKITANSNKIALALILGICVVFGLYTQSIFLETRPAYQVLPADFHRSFLLYMGLLVLISGYLAARTDDRVPLLIVVALVITVSSNVMWYHHYVFLLPLLIWMAWQKLAPSLVLWILTGLLIIQIDHYFLTTGFLVHLFVQLSILRVIYQQYSKLRATRFLSDLAAL